MKNDSFGSVRPIDLKGESTSFYRIDTLETNRIGNVGHLPFSIKILLEQCLRHLDHFQTCEADIVALANWRPEETSEKEIPFKPARVLLQDFTGVPALVDLASLRSSMRDLGGKPSEINPHVPVDLIIDHSIQVDSFGTADSLEINMEMEFKRNRERYEFLKWGESSFKNLRIYPPGIGIVHQVNLETLANVVQCENGIVFPDTVVGTDSHTPMINSLGVLGWGVGGIEAESVILGQPVYMKIPQVVGCKLSGSLKPETTATDLVFTIVRMLRKRGVVEKFVEFFGDALSNLSLADRATISNMAPEYGATMGFFPTDQETLRYLTNTGRSQAIIDRVERYTKEQGLFRTDGMTPPAFSETIELDLSTVDPSLAGPKRPQDRVTLVDMKANWKSALTAPVQKGGFALSGEQRTKAATLRWEGSSKEITLTHGSVVLAAITSCTNTSNPSVMIAAGLLAKKAVARGLKVNPWIKTSLAPGSRVVTDYLRASGLERYLEELGFFTVGYGCTSCIGNSGPLEKSIHEAILEKELVVASVLSGNRNFEGRVNPLTKANFLASPPLVVAYAIAGTVDTNLSINPLGVGHDGKPVTLREIWPSKDEIATIEAMITPEMYRKRYSDYQSLSPIWNEISTRNEEVYDWNKESTYIRNPPFFKNLQIDLSPLKDITNARVLVKVGDSITTDHISPAGAISGDSPAARYLIDQGIDPVEFNSYGSRRGNDEVMVRGTFANIRLRNQLVPETEGGYTLHLPTREQMSVYEAAMKYKQSGTPLIVLAGKEYGTGSSRDWAAKGTYLLGIKAVVAVNYERIHRSNLLGMGVLPLQFKGGDTPEKLGLTGEETYSIIGLNDSLNPKQELTLKIDNREVPVISRLDTPIEIEYYKNGGILHTVLRNFIKNA